MNPLIRSGLIVGALALSLSSVSQAATLVSVSQSGALRNINSTTIATWNFAWGGNQTFLFDRAEFTVDKDQSTIGSSTLTMTLWSGAGGNVPGNTVAQIGSLNTLSVITAASLEKGWNTVAFMFPASGALAAGNYSVQLTSDAAPGSDFNVKVGALTFVDVATDGTKTTLDSTYYTTDGNTDGTSTTAVPEPSTAIMGLLAPALLLMRRRRA